MTDTMNLAESLANEIARVSELRGTYAAMDGMPRINVKPVLYLIDASLLIAKSAVGSGNIVEMAKSIMDLKGFEG